MLIKLVRLLSLLIFLFLSATWQGDAQSYPIHNYTVADGLPSNTVYCVYKDSKGILWFATDMGIARYNGLKFEKFSTADGLPDNEIFCFTEDKQNRLWMGAYNGDLCYYKDGIIHTKTNTPWLNLPFKRSFICDISNEYDGSVTLHFFHSACFLNIAGNDIRIFNFKGSDLPSFKLLLPVKIAPTVYKIIYTTRTYYWDTSGKILSIRKNADELCAGLVSNGQRYLIGETKVYSDDRFAGTIAKHDSLKIVGIMEDTALHQVMTCSSDGLRIFPGNTTLFKGHEVSYATQDQMGNYWVSTTDAGVYCVNTGHTHFGVFKNAYKTPVKYARVVNGQLYFSTKDGNIYSLVNDTVRKLFDYFQYKDQFISRPGLTFYYNVDSTFVKKQPETGSSRRSKENTNFPIASFLDDSLNFYQMSSWDKLVLDQLQTGHARVKKRIPLYISGTAKRMGLSHGNLYLEMISDILYASKEVLDKQNWYEAKRIGTSGSKTNRIFGWTKDSAGNLWFSTEDSLYKIVDDKILVQSEYGAPNLRKFGLWNGFLMGYTHSNTLQICHLDNNRKLVLDTAINNSSIWSEFYQLDRTHILISSNDKYRMVTLTHPGQKNGFHIQTVESRFIPVQSEYICADTTACYFFENGTITRFDTRRLFDPSPKPIVYFIALKTKNNIYTAENISATIQYKDASEIQISYLPLSYDGSDLRCEYSVSQDSSVSWRPIEDAVINLYLSRPGTYYVRVRVRTPSDSYSPVATLQFTILKPFWATWWFILLAGIVTLAVIWWIILLIARRMLRQRQKAYDADMKYQRMEFKALNALMNPHFIFNTLNNIQNLFKNNGNRADEYFVTFARLIRQNMQNVTKDTISLEQELNLVANYLKLEKLRFDDFVNYKMDVDPELDLDNVFIPPLLIQPLVENSIRHGLLPKQSTDNFVTVHVYEKSKSLFIDVEDNGVGLSGTTSHIDPLHESLGLSNLRKRIEHMNRTRTEIITFELTEQKDDKGHVKGTLARIEIASDRW